MPGHFDIMDLLRHSTLCYRAFFGPTEMVFVTDLENRTLSHQGERPDQPTSERTSYWSESSTISLVVLDNHAVVFHKVYASAPSTQPLFTNKFTMFIGPDSSLVGESILFLLCSHLNKGERERKPHCQKLCTQVTYVWGNCRCHPRRCAMSQDSI